MNTLETDTSQLFVIAGAGRQIHNNVSGYTGLRHSGFDGGDTPDFVAVFYKIIGIKYFSSYCVYIHKTYIILAQPKYQSLRSKNTKTS